MLAVLLAARGFAQDKELRTIDAARFGVVVQSPLGWELVDLMHNDRAFVLLLPEEMGQPSGTVACELGISPDSLEEFRKRHQENAERADPNAPNRRLLIENELYDAPATDGAATDGAATDGAAANNRPPAEAPADAPTSAPAESDMEAGTVPANGGQANAPHNQRLRTAWSYTAEGNTRYELRHYVVQAGTLFTFVLETDQAHFEAYRVLFEELVASAKISEPETGVQALANGYWLQREFRFAVALPPEWKPAFGPNDRVLFFATGQTHEVFSDNFLVLAARKQPLDLNKLQQELPGLIKKEDENCEVPVCQVVPHADGQALETVVHVRRGPFELTVFERRFEGRYRNYEMKFTVLRNTFEANEAAFRQAFDSFKEYRQSPRTGVL